MTPLQVMERGFSRNRPIANKPGASLFLEEDAQPVEQIGLPVTIEVGHALSSLRADPDGLRGMEATAEFGEIDRVACHHVEETVTVQIGNAGE